MCVGTKTLELSSQLLADVFGGIGVLGEDEDFLPGGFLRNETRKRLHLGVSVRIPLAVLPEYGLKNFDVMLEVFDQS